jgi:hypothetical protein
MAVDINQHFRVGSADLFQQLQEKRPELWDMCVSSTTLLLITGR